MTTVVIRFRAMNTNIALLAPRASHVVDRAGALVLQTFSEVEQCLSRFLPDSELTALNRSGGEPFQASSLPFEAVSLAVSAARDTNGVFDPTVLAALEQAGYDRSFEQVGHAGRPTRPLSEKALRPDYRAVLCDPETHRIRLTAGQRIDLGGIGKGLAVDRALAATAFLPERCIAAGGDIAVRGNAEPDGGWTVALEDSGNEAGRSIRVRDAAVATSTTLKRRWLIAGREQHHLIDTGAGRPAATSVRSVTVIAESCVQADVAAKTALLLGDMGMAFLERHGLHGCIVHRDGSTASTIQWPA